ncbi:epoxyqueuosine reductase [Clostridium sp. A1-XYC3]|uniref:Epoxyqueuosine reductase n=1 Tax=Clostridium tanneri TaxID=3037988 RepID=A0ABU4JUT7_9CLOT|nr:epoxyqueuosine reductase [Clostridium sp. A1-XYC3]MDW8801924.1 epoxyqueuosine reductase [Clostridium sp. A1-XYC3]
MKNLVENLIKNYVRSYSLDNRLEIQWEEPLVSFADAKDSMFFELKKVIGENHKLPEDFLQNGKTVITYFIPFNKDIVLSNIKGRESSEFWAKAYVETNKLILSLNEYIKEELEGKGYDTIGVPLSINFDYDKLINDWSHRHAAYISGLGTFGVNNMLITNKGCCGRFGTIITSLEVEKTERKEKESCLYKYNGSCGGCVKRCVNEALKLDSFDRHKCFEMCLYNDKLYNRLGPADVCGKCMVGVSCSFTNPTKCL